MAITDKIIKGMIIDYKGEPHLIVEREFYKPGKGNAFNRTKLKSLISGKVVPNTFKSGEKVEEVEVNKKNITFLYNDDEKGYFMDPVSFEQMEISMDLIPGSTDYLHSEAKYVVSIYEERPISIQLPPTISLIVTETSGGVRGNTATNATKEAILETGAQVQVPLFIKEGDKVIINTESNSYLSKEN